MSQKYEQIREKLAEIEDELRRIGYWQDEPLEAWQRHFVAPFARDTMTFSQWLQFVFIPQVAQIIDQYESWPGSSAVGRVARTQYQGRAEAQNLVRLLDEFDRLFEQGHDG